MKKSFTPQFLTLILILFASNFYAQNLKLVPPPDMVVSSKFIFNFQDLKDPNNSTFGRLVFDLVSRKKVITKDLVCYKYCRKNLYTNYTVPLNQNIVPKPAPRQACEYYNSYFDTAHKDNKYELVWGFDGYATGDSVFVKEIQIQDYRHCSEGLIQRIFIVEDERRNRAQDTQDIWMVDCDYQYPISLACNNDVILNLDSATCEITVEPKMILSGSGICNSIYKVEVKPWTMVNAQLIDRNPGKVGVQLGKEDINKDFRITIIDPVTGNSCWTRAVVEYKAKPTIRCPVDISISCLEGYLPIKTGVPVIGNSCNLINISYEDEYLKGNCQKGYSWFIIRHWKAKDDQNNFAECDQQITILPGSINQLKLPQDYNDDLSSLTCIQKKDTNLNLWQFIQKEPSCVDGFLLDSVFWKANSNEPDIFPQRRRPRILGWNFIPDPNSPSGIVPSPDDQYYDSYSQITNGRTGCWNSEEYIQWKGTGRPDVSGCFNLISTYEDTYINSANPSCIGLSSSCFKVIRRWTFLDWCTGEAKEHFQIIKISDKEAPIFNYVSMIELVTDSSRAIDWNVPKPVWSNDCNESTVLYSIESTVGSVEGNSSNGYVIRNMPIGDHIVKIKVFDCCGNVSEKIVVVKIKDITSTHNPYQSKVKIYPNPTKGQINIISEHSYDQIIIQSLNGKKILSNSGSNLSILDISEFSSGIYFIKILKENRVIFIEKLVVLGY